MRLMLNLKHEPSDRDQDGISFTAGLVPSGTRSDCLWHCPLGNRKGRDPFDEDSDHDQDGKKRLHCQSAIAFVSISEKMKARRAIFLIYEE